MCNPGGKSLRRWLNQQCSELQKLDLLLKVIGDKLDTWDKEKFTVDHLKKYFRKKNISDYSLIKLIIIKYKGYSLDDYLPILDEKIENKIVKLFDDLCIIKKSNLCVHNIFIVYKCLDIIGETDRALNCKKVWVDNKDYRIRKWEQYEQKWDRFCPYELTQPDTIVLSLSS